MTRAEEELVNKIEGYLHKNNIEVMKLSTIKEMYIEFEIKMNKAEFRELCLSNFVNVRRVLVKDYFGRGIRFVSPSYLRSIGINNDDQRRLARINRTKILSDRLVVRVSELTYEEIVTC